MGARIDGIDDIETLARKVKRSFSYGLDSIGHEDRYDAHRLGHFAVELIAEVRRLRALLPTQEERAALAWLLIWAKEHGSGDCWERAIASLDRLLPTNGDRDAAD